MKYILTIIILFSTNVIFGQQITYSDWKKEAKTEIRLLPKYGNAVKTKEQKEADHEFIKTCLDQAGTSRKASDLIVKRGFDYLYKHDLRTAMYRFNQAWLLDPTNENVFWGFGAIYISFGDFESGIYQYDEGLKLNAKSSNILTDKATAYMTRYMKSHSDKDFNLAINNFKQSYSIDPKNQNTLFKMSACYFEKGDCDNAWKYYNECKALGGRPITKEYTEALIKGCKW
jgi:Tfp pilus assembly protein PilF